MEAEWVDVNVRTPEDLECVVMRHNGGKINGWYNPKHGWCHDGELLCEDIEITHWLELKD